MKFDTLENLKVKNGDVVDYKNRGSRYIVRDGERLEYDDGYVMVYPFWNDQPTFNIVSRASEEK